MYTRYICASANEKLADLSEENRELTEMLTEFAEECAADGRKAITIHRKNGAKHFAAGEYCGFARLTDGTLVEILPKTKSGIADARKELCAEFCRRCGFTFVPSALDPEMNFMEFFISVFAGETMKIIKSGVLSTYASREENMTTVHGTIMFAENIRRNLVHRERVYVRHDVFTPDRAENRLIKAAAARLDKITANTHSSHLLKETLSYLDEVRMPYDFAAEFGKCINTRNTKKYSTTLNICRMLFDKNEGTAFSGKYITCAQFFDMHTQSSDKKG
jgi:5-methylcytosine-specific restriction endonuclease McrBC regulatory subunit McrC